jgi:hypothetical protein
VRYVAAISPDNVREKIMRLKTTAILCGAVLAATLGGSLTAFADNIGAFSVTANGSGTPASNTFQYFAAALNSDGSVNTPGAFFSTLLITPPSSPNYNDPATFDVPVIFHYEIANGTGLVNTNIAATLNLTATSGATVANSINLPPVVTELETPLDNLVMTITANSPINGKSNLLTVTGTGTLSGIQFDTVGNANGDISFGDSVTFSSDFVDFSTATTENWNIALSSITPQLDYTPLAPPVVPSLVGDHVTADVVQGTPSGSLNSFTAAGDGTFAANFAPVPEPASLAILGLGGVGLLLKKRKKAL